MQRDDKKEKFNKTLGKLFQDIRKSNDNISISKFAREYDFDRGNFSRLERGEIGCYIITAYKICEAAGIKFSDFAAKLENNLGKDFKFFDE